MIAYPAAAATKQVARIRTDRRGVSTRLPELDEEFREIVRSLGYFWDGSAWYRKITYLSGSIEDRAAELCQRLLAAGYPVDAADEIVNKAVSSSFEPEPRFWILKRDGKFAIYWRGRVDDNLYARATSLPEARWDPHLKAVMVPPLYYDEVEGFADEHGFRFEDKARDLLEQSRRQYRRMIIPELPDPPVEKKSRRRRVRQLDPLKFADLRERHLVTLTDLLPHQVPAVEKLLPIKLGALFMDMGTGKTRCAIELAVRRQARTSKVVWFCPVSLKLTIATEIRKHSAGEDIYIFDDTTSAYSLPDAFWYIVGIESMSQSDRVVLAVDRLVDSDTFVIVDESSYIKWHASLRTKRITEIGQRARYRLLLTGTPISQGVVDLYAQMRFLSPEILGYNSFYSFASTHLEYSTQRPGLIVRSHGVDVLAERIAPFVYQVTKEECMDLPEKLYDHIYCDLTPEQLAAYWQAKEEILGKALDLDDISSTIIFELFTALQQIVSGYWNRDGKLLEFPQHRLEALQQAIASIPETSKIIIWCKYVYSVRKIAELLPDAALYYGELNERERSRELERFRGDGCRYLVATQATGGHGLTLNEANYHIFYENEFKYSHRLQAEDRSHRIGQTRPVTYIDIVSDSGIDSRIQKAIAKKEDVVKAFRREVQRTREVQI